MGKSFDFQVISHADEALDALDLAREKALSEIGQKAADYALMLAPVDTGRLKNSITYATKKTEGRSYQYTDDGTNGREKRVFEEKVGMGIPEDAVVIGTNVEYAIYQELGTSKIKNPQPFLRPAVIQHFQEYRKIAKDILSGKR